MKKHLTHTEINRINTLAPGQTIQFRGLPLTCRQSQPCQSGHNCTCCAFHQLPCNGVACLRGTTYLDAHLVEHPRQHDIYFTLSF